MGNDVSIDALPPLPTTQSQDEIIENTTGKHNIKLKLGVTVSLPWTQLMSVLLGLYPEV